MIPLINADITVSSQTLSDVLFFCLFSECCSCTKIKVRALSMSMLWLSVNMP